MPFPKNRQVGNRFSSTNQPKSYGKNGKKKSIVSKVKEIIKEEIGLAPPEHEAMSIIWHAYNKTQGDLQKIISDPNSSAIMVTIAHAIMKDQDERGLSSFQTLIERLYGKPAERKDEKTQSSINVQFDPSILSDNELHSILKFTGKAKNT